jgi:hypothetical protein
MGRKLVVALLAAFVAFFGVMAVANAAAPASSASAPNVAKPGTVAARDGAPFCDDRAASQPAAEPTPPSVDEGTLLVTGPKKGCNGDDRLAATDDRAPQQDDLQRSAPTARSVALMPSTGILDPAVCAARIFDRMAIDGDRDGFVHRDSPPPRPIPWAR